MSEPRSVPKQECTCGENGSGWHDVSCPAKRNPTSNVRTAFEAWLLKDHGRYWRPGSNGEHVFGPRSPHAGEYRDRTLQLLWTVWQAASAHETRAPPSRVAYDARGDYIRQLQEALSQLWSDVWVGGGYRTPTKEKVLAALKVQPEPSAQETSAVRAGVSVKDPTPPQEIILCAAMGPSGFICERPKGHPGRHCDGDNTRWDAEKASAHPVAVCGKLDQRGLHCQNPPGHEGDCDGMPF